MAQSDEASSAGTSIDRAAYEAALIDGGPETYKKRASRYDAHVGTLDWQGPKSVVDKWQSYANRVPGVKHKVLDAGCGTGQVGEQFVALSPIAESEIEIHGGDLSPDMLEVARAKSIYAKLEVVDLKQQLPYEQESFDSIVSAGVFLQGHCGLECLPNLIRVLKKGSYLIATARKAFYEATKPEWDEQIRKLNCALLEDNETRYHNEAEGVILVIHKQ